LEWIFTPTPSLPFLESFKYGWITGKFIQVYARSVDQERGEAMKAHKSARQLGFLVAVFICSSSLSLPCFGEYAQAVDKRSYNLGIVGAFSEVVRLGVKKLALSEVLPADEMDLFYTDAKVVTDRNEVQLYRETDLLISDLYPAEIARGLHVLLIYTGDTLDTYLALKADKARLVKSGKYTAVARRDIAVRFGQLLSYPVPVIEKLIRTHQQ